MGRARANPYLSELFLRRVWQSRLYTASGLKTADGKPVIIVSPGKLNPHGGPDFRDALIRIGSTTYCGDVELHVDAESWETHGHRNDPHYNRVVLHVVLTARELRRPARTASNRLLPLLVLHPFSDPVCRRVWSATYEEGGSASPRGIRCATTPAMIDHRLMERWLLRLGRERIELRIRRLEERLQQLVDEARGILREPYPRYYGNLDEIPVDRPTYTARDFTARSLWEQLLYEGVAEGMGYSLNRGAFLALARTIPLQRLRRFRLDERETIMAVLFGAAGLLPAARRIEERETRAYVRPLRRRWNELRSDLRVPLLHEGDWLFFRLRPVNFPTARLAAFCFLLPSLFGEGSIAELVSGIRKQGENALPLLRSRFTISPDPFWRCHTSFMGKTSAAGIALGRDRIDELLVNSFLPLLLLYARIFGDERLHGRTRELSARLPAPAHNATSRMMERQLPVPGLRLRTSLAHQGVLHLHSVFCAAGRCSECVVGSRVFGKSA